MANFTKDEQRTVMTLWCIFKSPLMFGGNLPDNDSFTLSLLTNKKVLEVLNKSINNRPILNQDNKVAWAADEPGTGARYLAVFNTSGELMAVPVSLKELGFSSSCTITDLWTGKVVGKFTGEFAPDINSHGSGLYRVQRSSQ